MRLWAGIALVIVIGACRVPSPATSAASAIRATSAPTQPHPVQPLTGNYGLLQVGSNLEVVGIDGSVAASVPFAISSLVPQGCGQGVGAWLLPAVSATSDHIYYRDGDTKVRMLIPPSSAVDVTTVPGGTNLVSGFSVSPDDQRIAVSVEQFSPDGISDRLYVEDLRGGGHHMDIFSTSSPAGKQPTMLWPMGWHAGHLVLAVWVTCTFEPVPYPSAWHVADAATADRLASIGDPSCVPGEWPSPAGVACFDFQPAGPGHLRLYDWNGSSVATLVTDNWATIVSPSGHLVAAAIGVGLGSTPPA
ncbi:MAG TPA: hypothetical protein VHO95_05475, partial [Candidatus Dormibacteraeota bacterium]|nr:hypothetical protein [Candidatus Dormibacteraeota bacterium]